MLGYRVKIEGEAPGIVMNNPASMKEQSTRVPTPDKEAEMKCYRLNGKGKHKNELYMPSEWIRAAILATASNIYKFKLGGKAQYLKRWVAGCADFTPEKIPLRVKDYEIYVTPAVVQSARVLRARPRIFPWLVEFNIEFPEDDSFYADLVKAIAGSGFEECVKMTGIKTGVGDNRPSNRKPGPHGRFKLVDFEVLGI